MALASSYWRLLEIFHEGLHCPSEKMSLYFPILFANFKLMSDIRIKIEIYDITHDFIACLK
jgi:hypothetical protein